jgi:hypothetical protein
MKTRYILILAAAAVAGIWFGRLAWRAHLNLVTLHARNMPLAEVVRSLEKQTWERIKYDKRLKARITLNVKDAPLDAVLDLVADRAGARWQKTFAVGTTGAAVSRLESVLEGESKLDAAGWTNVAPPRLDIPQDVIGGGPAPDQSENPVTLRAPGDGGPGPDQMPPGGARFIRRIARAGGPGGGGSGPAQGAFPGGLAGPGSDQIITTLPDGTTDQWDSEQIVLETDLLPGVGLNLPSEASLDTARRLASIVHARCRRYYDLAPAPFGMGGPASGRGLRLAEGGPHRRQNGSGSGAGPGGGGDLIASITQQQHERRLRELSRSPEEQVESARQKAANNYQFKSFTEDSETH